MGENRISRVLLTGGSGLIGKALREQFQVRGWQCLRAVRKQTSSLSSSEVLWDPQKSQPFGQPEVLEGTDVVIHLSGENLLGKRWTPEFKRRIQSSRVESTTRLATVLGELTDKPRLLLSASAIGIYGERGDEILNEDSSVGDGYLSKLCQAWEDSTLPAQRAGIRVLHLRIGVVLAPDEGALKASLPIFRMGLGGRLGTGRQWMSWISIQDLVGAVLHLISDDSDVVRNLRGSVNLTAPHPVRNVDYTRALALALQRPALLPVPRMALRLAFGEVADAALLTSCRTLPARLMQSRFRFSLPELPAALSSLLGTK